MEILAGELNKKGQYSKATKLLGQDLLLGTVENTAP
jgi:hypothetical protein